MSQDANNSTPSKPLNFIQQIIKKDLDEGVHTQVVTRFPPELRRETRHHLSVHALVEILLDNLLNKVQRFAGCTVVSILAH